jgi:hypothetical protein
MAYKPVHPSEATQYGYVDTTPAAPSSNVQTANGYTPIKFNPVNIYQPGQTLADFNTQATNQYTPAYNEKVNALKASLAQNLAALEGQKAGINQNYDTQVTSQNINNRQAKNNLSNTMLGRGLGRSSIVGTGLGEQDLINNRVINGINTYRNSALSNVDAQKVATETGVNNQVAGMTADLHTQIMNLAQSLYDSYQGNLYNQATFNSSGQFDADKTNASGQMDYNKFEYGKTQDTQAQSNWQNEYDLDKWYKEQSIANDKAALVQKVAASAASAAKPPAIKAGTQFAQHDAALKQIINSDSSRPQYDTTQMTTAINAIESIYANDNTKNGTYMRNLIKQAKAKVAKTQLVLQTTPRYQYANAPVSTSKITPVTTQKQPTILIDRTPSWKRNLLK